MESEHHTAFAPRRSAVQETLALNAQAPLQVLGYTRDEQLHSSPCQYDLAYGLLCVAHWENRRINKGLEGTIFSAFMGVTTSLIQDVFTRTERCMSSEL